MATFDRFDICGAHRALENDWNHGGWLQHRPSNLRRMEATHVQLGRMRYSSPGDACCAWEYLENDNQREIYVCALVSFGMGPMVDPDDETHAGIVEFIRATYVDEFIATNFPRVFAKPMEAYFIVDDWCENLGCVGFVVHYGNPYTAIGTRQSECRLYHDATAYVAAHTTADETAYRVRLARRHGEHSVKPIKFKGADQIDRQFLKALRHVSKEG